MSSATQKIKPGIYRHYKGNEYRVYEIASHTETNELLVVYRYLYGDFGLSVRPLPMFMDRVDITTEGGVTQVPRFECIRSADDGGLS